MQESQTHFKPKPVQFLTPNYEQNRQQFRQQFSRPYLPITNYNEIHRKPFRPNYHAETNKRAQTKDWQCHIQIRTSTGNIHCQTHFHSSLCRFCERQGISNTFHFMQTCTVKMNNISGSMISQQPNHSVDHTHYTYTQHTFSYT